MWIKRFDPQHSTPIISIVLGARNFVKYPKVFVKLYVMRKRTSCVWQWQNPQQYSYLSGIVHGHQLSEMELNTSIVLDVFASSKRWVEYSNAFTRNGIWRCAKHQRTLTKRQTKQSISMYAVNEVIFVHQVSVFTLFLLNSSNLISRRRRRKKSEENFLPKMDENYGKTSYDSRLRYPHIHKIYNQNLHKLNEPHTRYVFEFMNGIISLCHAPK